jgi:DmsE family decaheme c-type cytochrome
MSGKIRGLLRGWVAPITDRTLRALGRAGSLGSRLLLAAAFMAAQPALAGSDDAMAPKPRMDAYQSLIDFVQSGGPGRLSAAEMGGAGLTASNETADDYAVLQNFLANGRTDDGASDSSAPNDAVHASLHARASFPAQGAHAALLQALGASDSAPAAAMGLGAPPNDAIHAGLGAPTDSSTDDFALLADFAKGVDAGAALGVSPPADAIHAGLGASQKAADDYAALKDFADGADAPVMMAAAKTSEKKPAAKKADGGEAHYIGSEACVRCHRNQVGTFGETLHGDILLKHPRSDAEKLGCESCHGPGSKHAVSKEGDGGEPGDIIAFRKDSPRPVEERNAICLGCHEKGDRTYWKGSAHENQGLACTNCHQLMEKVSPQHQLVKSTEVETCFQCHKDRRAQFERPSHHPLREGDMTCSSCHNPHGSATDSLLREASVNETCYKCHADKRGPYLWEHEPVRDNCLNCHEPHGTVNEYLLKVQRPRLCQMCHMGPGHGNPGNPMTAQSVNRSCQNCHTKVHGSNSPAGSLFQR